MAGHPRVRQCQHCGRYFIPRTNRRTLYCDRVIRDGRTCKELGPAQKHKRAARNNEVIEAFDRNMRKRCERAMDAKDEQSDWAVYDAYCDWLEQARKARDGCVEYLEITLYLTDGTVIPMTEGMNRLPMTAKNAQL